MNLLKHCHHRPLARLASTLNQAASVSTFPTSNNSSDCETTAAYRDPVQPSQRHYALGLRLAIDG